MSFSRKMGCFLNECLILTLAFFAVRNSCPLETVASSVSYYTSFSQTQFSTVGSSAGFRCGSCITTFFCVLTTSSTSFCFEYIVSCQFFDKKWHFFFSSTFGDIFACQVSHSVAELCIRWLLSFLSSFGFFLLVGSTCSQR